MGSVSGSEPSVSVGMEAGASPVQMYPIVPLALRFQGPNARGNCSLPHYPAGLSPEDSQMQLLPGLCSHTHPSQALLRSPRCPSCVCTTDTPAPAPYLSPPSSKNAHLTVPVCSIRSSFPRQALFPSSPIHHLPGHPFTHPRAHGPPLRI